MAKERIHYLDVAKGIMIMLVMLYHLYQYGRHYDTSVVNNGLGIAKEFWLPFFMSVFFVITGMCSNFSKPFLSFAISNFKTLVLSAMMVMLVFCSFVNILEGNLTIEKEIVLVKLIIKDLGVCWFVTALFIAKMIFWFINAKSKTIEHTDTFIWISSLLVFIIGYILYLHDGGTGWIGYKNALMMVWCFPFGILIKRVQIPMGGVVLLLFLYVTTCVLFIVNNERIPFIAVDTHIPLVTLIPFLLLASTGSYLLLYFSKIIGKCEIVEYIGRQSLVIYMTHCGIYGLLFNISSGSFFEDTSLFVRICGYVTIYTITVAICLSISSMLNTKYFRFMLGRF